MIPLAMLGPMMGMMGGGKGGGGGKEGGQKGLMDMAKNPVKAIMSMRAKTRDLSNKKIDAEHDSANARVANMQRAQSETAKLMNSLKTFS